MSLFCKVILQFRIWEYFHLEKFVTSNQQVEGQQKRFNASCIRNRRIGNTKLSSLESTVSLSSLLNKNNYILVVAEIRVGVVRNSIFFLNSPCTYSCFRNYYSCLLRLFDFSVSWKNFKRERNFYKIYFIVIYSARVGNIEKFCKFILKLL